MEFIIFRKSWRRGGNSEGHAINKVEQKGDVRLLNSVNMFCCLGMCAIQCGIVPIQILSAAEPDDIDSELIPKKTILWDRYGQNSALSDKAMEINDDSDLSEEEREQKLTRVFSKRGHTITFVDQLAPKKWRIAQ